MRTEIVLRRIAIGCAIFMLFGPIGGRTMWVKGHSTATDAAGYNMAALVSGVVALVAFAFALWMRERGARALPALGAVAAIAAFALSVAASGVYVWARWQGEVFSYASGGFAGDMERKWTVHLAWGPPFFALAALIGALASLALAAFWLRRPQGNWTSFSEPVSGASGLPHDHGPKDSVNSPSDCSPAHRWRQGDSSNRL